MACNSINSTIEIFTLTVLIALFIAVLAKEKKQKQDWSKLEK